MILKTGFLTNNADLLFLNSRALKKRGKIHRIFDAEIRFLLHDRVNGSLIMLNRSNASQLVILDLDSKPTTVLCHMGDFGCGDGGWTPVMKTDGNKVCLVKYLNYL